MSTIYKSAKQTIMWLGEEKSYTHEAFYIMPILTQALPELDSTSDQLDRYRGQLKDRSALRSADKIQKLLT
jgi:hypothetical protein